MAFEETKEQQQLYVWFRACIYLILVLELIMNLPVEPDGAITGFFYRLIEKFRVFNHVGSCKVMEFIFVCVTAIGTKAKKDVDFSWKRMVIIPVCVGVVSTMLCFIFHPGHWLGNFEGISGNRILYALFSVVGVVMIHQGLDAIAKYYTHKVGDDRFNFENESFEQSDNKTETPYSVNIPMIY